MQKVLLVDDEPFILQGLKVLIEWEQEGFEIAATASNGAEALAYLRENKADLIIADINMPEMTGLELLERIRMEKLSEAYFIILTGYAKFSYAQQAIQYDCMDYILKPIEKKDLIQVLHKVLTRSEHVIQRTKTGMKMERAYLARNMIAVIIGKFDAVNLQYVKEHLRVSEGVRYVEVELDSGQIEEEISDEEKRSYQRKLYDACVEFLKEDSRHCVFDVSGHEKIYDIGFVYCDYMARDNHVTEKEYLQSFLSYLRGVVGLPVITIAGKRVTDISQISKSYGTACMLRSFQGFRARKDIYYYEEEIQITSRGGIVICKKSLDDLLNAVEQNNHSQIIRSVEAFYGEMQQLDVTGDTMNLNINYLLFQLIHLATQQDDCVNQEEILRFISESSFENGIMRGSKAHLSRFACEYGDYLAQLRKNVSHGVLSCVEKDILKHFSENMTLKGLSEKYFVNSAYLGQIFRKKYGQSFKDYLNRYRIEQASAKLLRTDEKIYQIAEDVGYHDLDYFVNRFIAVKGCTPTKFRNQARSVSE